jgi:hypothetical protein
LNWVRLPRQIDEFLEEMAMEEFKKVEGRSKIMVITVAGSAVFLLCPRKYLSRALKEGGGAL